jgi:hypothetical protein
MSRGLGLITLAGVLFMVAPANRVTTVPVPIASPTVSPTPVTTPKDDEERPNAVRRFFSWVKDGVTRPFRKRTPEIRDNFIVVSLSSSNSLITFCPKTGIMNNCASNPEVRLFANAIDPEVQDLLFTWMVTSGRLRGEGREVIWDLSGVPEGTYTATVEVNDGRQRTAADTTKVTVSLCDGCDRPPPLCPSVSVSCPSGVESKSEITFVANVSGGEPDLKPTLTWSVTAGKIISGQGTSKIRVDASNVPRSQSITATVSAEGFHPACTVGTASCTIAHWD